MCRVWIDDIFYAEQDEKYSWEIVNVMIFYYPWHDRRLLILCVICDKKNQQFDVWDDMCKDSSVSLELWFCGFLS